MALVGVQKKERVCGRGWKRSLKITLGTRFPDRMKRVVPRKKPRIGSEGEGRLQRGGSGEVEV